MRLFKKIDKQTKTKIQKHFFLFYFCLLPFFVFQLYTMNDMSLSGEQKVYRLVENSFRKLNLSFKVPKRWKIFDISHNSQYFDGLKETLIIDGTSPPGEMPTLQIYDLKESFLNQYDSDPINTILLLDLDRIENYYEESSEPTTYFEDDYTSIEFSYQFDNFLSKGGWVVLCKDWIGVQDNHRLLVSICATEGQWTWLDDYYSQIINSINFED